MSQGLRDYSSCAEYRHPSDHPSASSQGSVMSCNVRYGRRAMLEGLRTRFKASSVRTASSETNCEECGGARALDVDERTELEHLRARVDVQQSELRRLRKIVDGLCAATRPF